MSSTTLCFGINNCQRLLFTCSILYVSEYMKVLNLFSILQEGGGGGGMFDWKSTPCQNLIELIESINNLCSKVLHTINLGKKISSCGGWAGQGARKFCVENDWYVENSVILKKIRRNYSHDWPLNPSEIDNQLTTKLRQYSTKRAAHMCSQKIGVGALGVSGKRMSCFLRISKGFPPPKTE